MQFFKCGGFDPTISRSSYGITSNPMTHIIWPMHPELCNMNVYMLHISRSLSWHACMHAHDVSSVESCVNENSFPSTVSSTVNSGCSDSIFSDTTVYK